MNKIVIYLAGPLFSLSEQRFNKDIAKTISQRMPNLHFILPQESASDLITNGASLHDIFNSCIHSVEKSDALLCILDGPDVDSGTCIEMGYAYALKKPIIGIRTDFRSSEDMGVNLMVSKVCNEMIWLPKTDMTLEQVSGAAVSALKRVLKQP